MASQSPRATIGHTGVVVLACVTIAAACANFKALTEPTAVPETDSSGEAAALLGVDVVAGYLRPEALPNSVILLPPPPAAGSAALASDEQTSRQSLSLRATPRWMLAVDDADMNFPHAADTFSCSLNAPVTERDTPRLYMLMRRIRLDADESTSAAKNRYKRARPFVANAQPVCTPERMKHLLESGSYPSGHSAVGWAWALVLSEIAPEHADAILARGRAYGQSRVVCNVHWQSDVDEGRVMGAASVARMHADPTFRADIETAKAELAAVHVKGLSPTRDCKAEADALSLSRELR
jgi:acid phosphatase (class A)